MVRRSSDFLRFTPDIGWGHIMESGKRIPVTAIEPSAPPPTADPPDEPAMSADIDPPLEPPVVAVAVTPSPGDLEAAARQARDVGRVRCHRHATWSQTIALLTYLSALLVVVVYNLFTFWPRPTPSEQVSSAAAARGGAAPRDTSTSAASAGDTTRRAVAAPAATPTTATTSTAAAAVDSFKRSDARRDSAMGVCDARRAAGLLAAVASDSVRAQLIGMCYLGKPLVIWKETQLVLLVFLAGALGGLLSCLRSTTGHFYKGDLCAEGLPGMYTWPLSGAIMGLVFYVFIRGGFFSGQSNVAQTSTYSFIATAMLAGMFMHEAVAKLRQIAETLLTRVDTKPLEAPPGTPAVPVVPVVPVPAAGTTTPDAGERGVIPVAPIPTASPPGTVG